MLPGMAMSRITITIDDGLLAQLRERVGPGEVSAYVVGAIEHRLRKDPVMDLIDMLGDIYGPLTDEELEEAERCVQELERQLSSTQGPSSASPQGTGR